MVDQAWSLSAVADGFRVRLLGPGGRTVFEAAEDVSGARRASLKLWAADDGRLVVRVPGTTERPVVVVDPADGSGRACPSLPFDVRDSSTNARFHPVSGTVSFLHGGDPPVVWLWELGADEWVPVVGPLGFKAHDVAVGGDRLFVGGDWDDAPAVVEVTRAGDVVADRRTTSQGWKRRWGPVTGSFFGVHLASSDERVVGVNPRLHGFEDDTTYVWMDGQWTRFAQWVRAVDAGQDVALLFNDATVAVSAGDGWRLHRPPIPGPVRDMAGGQSGLVVATTEAVVSVGPDFRTCTTLAEADPMEEFWSVAVGHSG